MSASLFPIAVTLPFGLAGIIVLTVSIVRLLRLRKLPPTPGPQTLTQ
jgi:hypothetical protein